MKGITLGAVLATGLSTAGSLQALSLDEVEMRFGAELVMGGYRDEAMRFNTGGLEAQVFQVTRALLKMDATKDNWGMYLEPVLAGDEVDIKKDDTSNYDYYRSLGNDLYHYGDLPLREAYAYWEDSSHVVKAGRQQSLLGLDFDNPFYEVRHHSPHSIFKDQVLITGLSYAYKHRWFEAGMALASGAPRPGDEYNYQHEGVVDPNFKGNNTAIRQLSLKVPLGKSLVASAGWQYNKTGSAPGNSEFSGKHNDRRYMFGLGWSIDVAPSITWEGYYQQARYLVGLTESGSQGRKASTTSLDITKHARYMVNRLGIHQWFLQYTYEKYDRADTNVFVKVANFDVTHPVMSDVETNKIVSIGYEFKGGSAFELYFKQPKLSYSSASHIPNGHDLDKIGVVFTTGF